MLIDHSCNIVSAPQEVSRRLQRLGLVEEVIQEALRFGEARANDCTAFNATSAAGFYRWDNIVAFMRGHLRDHSWEVRNIRNFPLSVHPSRTHSLSFMSGNEFTGVDSPEATPTARNPRGSVSRALIESNRQLKLDDMLASVPRRPGRIQGQSPHNGPLYVLLFDVRHGRIYSEVSLPVRVGSGGKVSEWAERIILSPYSTSGSGGPTRETLTAEQSEPIVLTVKRRSL